MLVYKKCETKVEYAKIDRMFFLDDPNKQRKTLVYTRSEKNVEYTKIDRMLCSLFNRIVWTNILSIVAYSTFVSDLVYTRVVLCLIGLSRRSILSILVYSTFIDRMFVQTIRLNREKP
jgi:hypothetical protein